MKPRLIAPFVLSAACLLSCLIAIPSPAQKDKPSNPNPAHPRRFSVDDLDKLVALSDPQISPGGKSIVIVVNRSNVDKNRHDHELVLVDVDTGKQRVLTHDRPSVQYPRWSPTGDRLAFIADANGAKEDKAQVFVMPMNGGDAKRITHAAEGVQQLAWSPDGTQIAYATEDEPEDKKARDKGDNAFEVGDNDYLATEAPKPVHIWIAAADGSKSHRLTSGTWSLPSVPPPGSPDSPISWSPDGKSILFVRQATPHFGNSDQSIIQIVNVSDGKIRSLTNRTALESYPALSPDGQQVTYWYPREGDPNNVNEIQVTSVSGGEGSSLTRKLDRNIQRCIWMPDSKSVLLGGHDGTHVALWQQPLDGPAKRLNLGAVSPSWLYWVDVHVGKNGSIAFTGSEPRRPTELYYMASSTATPKRLTDFNKDIAALDLGNAERITWKGPDDFEEDGVLFYPPDFTVQKKYPLILVIHGGPTSASAETFAPLPQLMAAHGYIVFSPNYRGSDNLGNAYQRAIFNDACAGPGRDIMAGIEAVKKRGFVDAERIAVSGWSYGGCMTTWMIANYHIWKTAVTGASAIDWNDEYNLSDGNITQRYSFGGSPWSEKFEKAYRDQSPLTYAPKIKTPTLILATTGDARVPITQSYRLYHALKDNGVTTKFIAYPVPGHFPADPVRAKDVAKRWVGWLDQYLR